MISFSIWQRLILLAVAGVVGTLARYGVYLACQQLPERLSRFPWATLTVNLTGSFLFGLIWPLAESKARISTDLRLVLLVGFVGTYTTFSTFAFETGRYMQGGLLWHAALNMLANNVLGIAAFFAGLAIASKL